jgi:DNA polymerase-3 subunit delta'
MSQRDDDDTHDAPHPRQTVALFGHAAAETALLAAYRAGRIPHGILIAGPKGIGKATLAYRIARFILSHPDPVASDVQDASSFQVDAANPVARRIAAQAQPDLLVIERTVNERGVLRNQVGGLPSSMQSMISTAQAPMRC